MRRRFALEHKNQLWIKEMQQPISKLKSKTSGTNVSQEYKLSQLFWIVQELAGDCVG